MLAEFWSTPPVFWDVEPSRRFSLSVPFAAFAGRPDSEAAAGVVTGPLVAGVDSSTVMPSLVTLIVRIVEWLSADVCLGVPFSDVPWPEFAVGVASALLTARPAWLTVTSTVAEPDKPSPESLSETEIVAAPEKREVGVKVSPLRAALRLASVPLMVIEADLLAPETTFTPLVVASLRVPCVAVSTISSVALPASGSVPSMASSLAVEKTSDEFSLTDSVDGAVTVGGCESEFTVMVLDPVPVRFVPVSKSETLSVSVPT